MSGYRHVDGSAIKMEFPDAGPREHRALCMMLKHDFDVCVAVADPVDRALRNLLGIKNKKRVSADALFEVYAENMDLVAFAMFDAIYRDFMDTYPVMEKGDVTHKKKKEITRESPQQQQQQKQQRLSTTPVPIHLKLLLGPSVAMTYWRDVNQPVRRVREGDDDDSN